MSFLTNFNDSLQDIFNCRTHFITYLLIGINLGDFLIGCTEIARLRVPGSFYSPTEGHKSPIDLKMDLDEIIVLCLAGRLHGVFHKFIRAKFQLHG